MYVKWEWNLKECVIFETFLHSLPHLFFWNLNLLPYKKKKIKKNSNLWFPTHAHIILLNLTLKNSASFGFLWRAIFFKGCCTCDLCMGSGGCVQCLFSMRNGFSALFWDWFCFFFQQVRPSTHLHVYTWCNFHSKPLAKGLLLYW